MEKYSTLADKLSNDIKAGLRNKKEIEIRYNEILSSIPYNKLVNFYELESLLRKYNLSKYKKFTVNLKGYKQKEDIPKFNYLEFLKLGISFIILLQLLQTILAPSSP